MATRSGQCALEEPLGCRLYQPEGFMRLAILVACLLLWSCASSTSVSAPPLEGDLAGTWTGTATLALAGRSPIPYSARLPVAVSGNTARVASICPGTVENASVRGSAVRLPTESAHILSYLNATGSGAFASWSGILECPKFQVRGCDVLTVTYTNATVALTDKNQVTVVATGNAEGCSIAYPVFFTFVGAK